MNEKLNGLIEYMKDNGIEDKFYSYEDIAHDIKEYIEQNTEDYMVDIVDDGVLVMKCEVTDEEKPDIMFTGISDNNGNTEIFYRRERGDNLIYLGTVTEDVAEKATPEDFYKMFRKMIE